MVFPGYPNGSLKPILLAPILPLLLKAALLDQVRMWILGDGVVGVEHPSRGESVP